MDTLVNCTISPSPPWYLGSALEVWTHKQKISIVLNFNPICLQENMIENILGTYVFGRCYFKL